MDRNANIPKNPAPAAAGPAGPIRCTVEQVTFRDEQSLYTVMRVKDSASGDVFTAVGEIPSCSKGEEMLLEGAWRQHPKYGSEFRVERTTPLPPSTLEGIEKYLASSAIHGIGKGFAGKIVRKFGTKTLDVIEQTPEKLLKIRGLGRSRLDQIVAFFKERERERAVMLFLYSNGITPAYASRIYRRYRTDSIAAIQENPYRLADDIHGIGFRLADRVAMNLGIQGNAPERIRAAVLYTLSEAESEGHCFLTREQVLETVAATIAVDHADVEVTLGAMLESGRLVSVSVSDLKETFEPTACIYTSEMHGIEKEAASRLRLLLQGESGAGDAADIEAQIARAEGALGIAFAAGQREAIRRAVTQKVSIITGGPGTGKTTIVRAIVAIFRKLDKKVLLCAPTGRAAKRLSEATGSRAKTIHRLLRWNPSAGMFDFNEDNPLDCDLLIVDEMSMVDIRLLVHLLRALTPRARILVVGDADQLPSVGPGSTLRDMLKSAAIASTRLDEVFRQAAASMIISNAHRINRGVIPVFEPEEGQDQDFYFIDRAEPEDIAGAVVEMAASRIPARYAFHPLSGIQVLSPMHKGVIGVKALNDMLARTLNAGGRAVQGAGEALCIGDKVMQIRNNYDLEVFNGDIGIVTGVSDEGEDKVLMVNYDGRTVRYPFESTDEIVKAYAISIHKSQGSEYDCVVVPVSTSHYIMLQRNLLYTAITRARKLVVLVGTKKALAIAVKNDKVRERNTLLARFLSEEP